MYDAGSAWFLLFILRLFCCIIQNFLKHDLDAQRHFEKEWRNRLGHQGFLHCLCKRTHGSTNLTHNGAKASARAPNWASVSPRGTATRGLIPRGCHWVRLFARVYGDTLQLFEAGHPVASRRAANLHSYLNPPRPFATVFDHALRVLMHHTPRHTCKTV